MSRGSVPQSWEEETVSHPLLCGEDLRCQVEDLSLESGACLSEYVAEAN